LDREKKNRFVVTIELSTWFVLILIIFGVRFLPVKLLTDDSVFLLIGIITSLALFYYLIAYKYFAKTTRFYIKNIADIVLIGVLIHLLKDYGEFFFALYFLPIAAAALSMQFINALLIATIASLFVIFEFFLSSQGLLPTSGQYFQGVWQVGLILFITIFCRMLAMQLREEKSQKEESLAREKALREESIRQKEFLSMTSHQLFTPLSMIRGFVSMLNDESLGKLAPKQKEAVDEIHKNSKRMVGLVSELLSISRIESGGFVLKKEKFSLENLIADCVNGFTKTIAKEDTKLIFQKPEKILPVEADPEKVRQVINNLIDNALKYTQKGSVTINILQSKDWTTVRVSDEGVGLCQDYKENLFQPFFRGKNILELDNQGTGLGLYISKIIIEKHGGHISAENNKPRGATFEFSLPMVQYAQEQSTGRKQ
jgi:signal transduction histidine kinase